MPPQLPPPQTFRERLGALRNLPPFLKLVWQTSPGISVAQALLRLGRSLLPVAALYIGAKIIDEVVRLTHAPSPGATFSEWLASGMLDHIALLLALEFGLGGPSDLLGRGISLLDSLLSEKLSTATSVRLMEHAARLDLEDFEDSEFQDRLERARMQAAGRTGLMSQLFGQAQDLVTIASFAAGLFVYSPWLIALLALGLIPPFICRAHFNAQSYWLHYRPPPERRELGHGPPVAARAA